MSSQSYPGAAAASWKLGQLNKVAALEQYVYSVCHQVSFVLGKHVLVSNSQPIG